MKRARPAAAPVGEEDFPRGAPLVADEPSRGGKNEKKRDTKPRAIALERFDEEEEKAEGVKGKLQSYAPFLKYKSITVGMKLWGRVSDLGDKQLTVSLPAGLKGTVKLDEASDDFKKAAAGGRKASKKAASKKRRLSSGAPAKAAEAASDSDSDDGDDEGADAAAAAAAAAAGEAGNTVDAGPTLREAFTVGQLVCAIVTKVSKGETGAKDAKGKHITLSLRLSRIVGGIKIGSISAGDILLASVTSVEDHGYVLSFGSAEFTGFLLLRDCTDDKGRPRPLARGTQLRVAATAVDKANKVVRVSAQPSTVDAAVTGEGADTNLAGLLPGSLVNARVRAVLSDGLLLAFMTYFTGTVDLLSMEDPMQSAGQLASAFVENQRCRARILFVDPTNKRIGLTLSKHLVALSEPPPLPPVGTVIENAIVRRLDTAVGLLCELRHEGDTAAGYAHISSVSDTRVDKLEKAFKRGQRVRARVVGHRAMDGLAVLTLKPSVLDQAYLSFEEIRVGAVATGKISSVEAHGLYVTLGERLRVLVPASHISETASVRITAKRFQVGTSVTCRILDVDSSTRKARATLKRSLVESKLPPLASAADAAPGAVAHGVITGVQAYGCFVEFYNKVKAMAHKSHLGLLPDEDPTTCFQVGQVVKCTVIGPDSSGRGLRVSFSRGPTDPSAAPAAAAAGAGAGEKGAKRADKSGGASGGSAHSAGQVVPTATVKSVNAAAGLLEVALPGGETGVLEAAHLSDYVDAAKQLFANLHEGFQLGPVLLLEHQSKRQAWRVTRKPALVAAGQAGSFPKELSDLHKGAIVVGFVANVTGSGVFVRFGGRVTGLAPLSQIGDAFVSNPQELFAIGQTVRAQVLSVDAEASKAVLSLRPPAGLSEEGAPFLTSLLKDLRDVDSLAAKKEGTERWAGAFPLGGLVKGKVAEVKDFGVVVDLPGHPDVVAFISSQQAAGEELSEGSSVKACVLDVSEANGVVDLGLREGLLESLSKKKKGSAKASADTAAAGTKVKAVVEAVKGQYLVLSVPALGCLALAQPWAFNPPQQNAADEAQKRFEVGQKGESSKAASAAGPSAASSEPQEATVVKVSATEVLVHLASGREGRMHVTQFAPAAAEGKVKGAKGGAAAAAASPLARFEEGATLSVRAVGLARSMPSAPDGKSFLEVAPVEADAAAPARTVSFEDMTVGKWMTGYVVEITAECIWVGFTPTMKGRLDALCCGLPFEEIAALPKGSRFALGQALKVTVTEVDLEKFHLDLALDDNPPNIQEGALIAGRVARAVAGTGLYVDLGYARSGRVPLTAIRDAYADGLADGQAVKVGTPVLARVTRVDGGKVDLSLRASRGGCEGRGAVPEKTKKGYKPVNPEVKTYGMLQPGMEVAGFVKNTSKKGCFVSLSPGVDARVLLSNLSDAFVADPAKSFPPGKLVRGTIVSLDAAKGFADMSLKSDASASAASRGLADLSVGEIVTGSVRKVETFGVFVTVDGCAVSGLCHISEVADERIKSLPARVSVGERVKAVVLRIDVENRKLSLGMKPSYFGEEKTDGAGKKRRFEEDLLLDTDDELDADEPAAAPAADEDMVEASGRVSGKAIGKASGKANGKAAAAAAAAAAADSDDENESESESEEEEEVVPAKKAKKGTTAGAGGAAGPSAERQSAALRSLLADVAGVSDPSAVGADADDAAFDWEVAPRGAGAGGAAGAADDDDDGEPTSTASKKSKRQKLREREDLEKKIRERELALADGNEAPQTANEFERRLMASPNSSFLWIRFMAFQISLGELEAARAVAERALETVNYREENELLNLWVAYLNLENMHGEPREEAVLRVFQRARARCDEKRLLLALVGIYERTAHAEDAEKTLTSACRKFSGSCKVWLRKVAFDLQQKSREGSSATVDRAVKALPARKHVKFLTQTALLEFRTTPGGSAERGRTLFEGVLQAHPRRLDLWSVYIDQEVKLSVGSADHPSADTDKGRVRALMERAVHTDQPAKKMKFLFKRYLQFEAEHGDAASVAHVRKLAAEFVESKGGGAL